MLISKSVEFGQVTLVRPSPTSASYVKDAEANLRHDPVNWLPVIVFTIGIVTLAQPSLS
jgi:hypothetical protein